MLLLYVLIHSIIIYFLLSTSFMFLLYVLILFLLIILVFILSSISFHAIPLCSASLSYYYFSFLIIIHFFPVLHLYVLIRFLITVIIKAVFLSLLHSASHFLISICTCFPSHYRQQSEKMLKMKENQNVNWRPSLRANNSFYKVCLEVYSCACLVLAFLFASLRPRRGRRASTAGREGGQGRAGKEDNRRQGKRREEN